MNEKGKIYWKTDSLVFFNRYNNEGGQYGRAMNVTVKTGVVMQQAATAEAAMSCNLIQHHTSFNDHFTWSQIALTLI